MTEQSPVEKKTYPVASAVPAGLLAGVIAGTVAYLIAGLVGFILAFVIGATTATRAALLVRRSREQP